MDAADQYASHHTIRRTPLTSAYGLIQPGVTMPAPGV